MARYKIILAYDGTQFFGMQRQAKERSVQAEFEAALRKIGWQGESIQFAGRTDRGVHASGQVVAFDFDWRHELLDLQAAINGNLAGDLAVQKVGMEQENFHPRFDAKKRTYRYSLIFSETRQPLEERYSWRVWPTIDFEHLKELSKELLGAKDFAALGTPQKTGASTVREIISTKWQGNDREATFEISANAFLYHMVRRTVGLLIRMDRKGKSRNEMLAILENKILVQDLAPARGLSLVKIDYKK